MITYLWIWLALMAVMLAIGLAGRSAAGTLSLAYFASFSLIHIPGAFAQSSEAIVLPGREYTQVGLQYTMYAMEAFVIGSLLGLFRLNRSKTKSGPSLTLAGPDRRLAEVTGMRFFLIGIACFFILPRLLSWVPSADSIFSTLAMLLVIGIWLRVYAGRGGSARESIITILMMLSLPLLTMAGNGFLSFGISWLITCASFAYTNARRRWIYVLAFPFAAFLGLSVLTTYLGGRTNLRDVVWKKDATLVDRTLATAGTFANFKLFDLNDKDQLAAVDSRLNQNFLVGRAVEYVEGRFAPLLMGQSVSPILLIPRALWPDKPAVGGGRDLVTRYTGIPFNEYTSVGAGQVLEFYINFGTLGIIVGFFLLGLLLRVMDRALQTAFDRRSLGDVISIGLPGITLLQPGGNLLEIMVSFVAAILVAKLTRTYLVPILVRGMAARLQTRRRPGATSAQIAHAGG